MKLIYSPTNLHLTSFFGSDVRPWARVSFGVGILFEMVGEFGWN